MVKPSALIPPFSSEGASTAASPMSRPRPSNFTRYWKSSSPRSVDDTPFSSAGLSEVGSRCCTITSVPGAAAERPAGEPHPASKSAQAASDSALLIILFPTQDRETIRCQPLAPGEIIETRTRSFVAIAMPPAIDDSRARSAELLDKVLARGQGFFVDEKSAARPIRIGIPSARLAPLPIVADQDRRGARIEVDHRRKAVSIGHDDGFTPARQLRRV